MAYKLAFGNVVKVPVHFSVNDDGKVAEFDFTLTCKRISQEEMTAGMKNEEGLISAFMAGVVTGWNGQTMVIDEDGKPVAFTADALEMMLGVTGIPMVFYLAYLKECRAKAKN